MRTTAAVIALALALPTLAGTFHPSRTEKAAIVRAFGDPPAALGCLIVRIARADRSYASVFPRVGRTCTRWAFNGSNVLRHARGKWKIVFEGSDYRCPLPRIPRVVQRELGVCR